MFSAEGLPSIGVFADCTDRSMPIVELAKALEDRGFTGLFLNEHPHLPVASERSAYPAGGEIPDRYARFWDPYIALSFVAAQTSLEIGPTVSLVAEHDAIALAKAVATLDVLSGGRLLLGVGFGWHREEFEDHGLPANVRAAVVEETVEMMKRLWCDDVAEYAGSYRRLSPSRSWPKPAQQPHPPVLLGAPASERNFERVARWADGWIPMANPILEPAYEAWLTDLRRCWDARGPRPRSAPAAGAAHDDRRSRLASRHRTRRQARRAARRRAGQRGRSGRGAGPARPSASGGRPGVWRRVPVTDELLARVTRIEAYQAIQQLPIRYALAVDGRDLDTWVGLFEPDVDMGRHGRGRQVLRDYIEPHLRWFYRSIHQIVGHRIEIIDDDTARGAVYCRAEHEVGDRWIVMAICYFDDYRRVDGEWFFARRAEKHWYAVDVLERPQAVDFDSWERTAGPPTLPHAFPTWAAFFPDAAST